MPKQTFFNLPEEKREKILEVAIDEFAKNPYINASLTKIAEHAGIAKGSMYQYFEDKLDLYRYILQISGDKKLGYLKSVIEQFESMGFMEMVRQLYVKGFEFARDNPKLAAIGNHFLKENNPEVKEAMYAENGPKSNTFFEYLIEQGKAKGQINPKIDTATAAYVITSLNLSIVDYFLSQTKAENLLESSEIFLQLIDKMLFILQHGFEARTD